MRRLLSAAVLAALLSTAPAAAAAPSSTLAVLGDMPYGEAQLRWFPTLVADVNSDPDVSTVVHVGDIKSGSQQCSDAYFAQVRGLFDTFDDPLVYTPGDNEWTDCHRPNNGAYDPLERLVKLRQVFFPEPGRTLGAHPAAVEAQSAPHVENAMWTTAQVVLSTVHVVGSNNGLAPWTGRTEPTAEQLAEAQARTAAAVEWIDATFDRAESAPKAKGVVIAMQADMWDGTAQDGFAAIKQRIAERAAAFRRPVLLLEGDSHSYLEDQPFPSAPNVTRIVVEGAAEAHEWLKVTIRPDTGKTFSWSREVLPPPAA